ncbi:hypothetical protein BpHYR1_014736 [Brachionus plicatilis]|uniref:Uncharacterized protein n=1 Tax=Brachionus plicatilis TaxID=10195 RepID=A0A3M7T7K5_BRAPC|nr:hypothetical protein BpHYR1_014736 [Brachionus plicatilis]
MKPSIRIKNLQIFFYTNNAFCPLIIDKLEVVVGNSPVMAESKLAEHRHLVGCMLAVESSPVELVDIRSENKRP